MHDADRRLGWAAFSLTYILKGVFVVSPEDVIYTPSVLGYNSNGSTAMKPVTFLTFSDFCIAGQERRKSIVDNFADPKYGSSPVRGMFQRTHWKTGDIDTLLRAKPNVAKSARNYARVVASADALKRDYIALWRRREADFFEVPRLDFLVGDLTVRVNPEVGMLTVDGAQALKVWLGLAKMHKRRYEVCHYLFGEATKDPKWPGWPIGIWDVRRLALPLAPPLPDSMEDDVLSAASEFIRLLE